MKRFLLKLVSFLIGFWAGCLGLARTADHFAPMNVYTRSQEERLAALMGKRDSIQAISLGNSHSDAIDFDTFGLSGQVLARAGTDLFEVKEYAYSIVPKLPSLNTVFIAVSYFSFSRNNLLLEDTKNLRIELYAMLPTWTPLPEDLESFVLGKLHRYFYVMNVIRPDHWENVITEVFSKDVVNEIVPYNPIQSTTPWGVCDHFTQADLTAIGYEIAGKAATNHSKIARLSTGIYEDTSEALAETIEMLQRRGVRVILFTPPYYEAYTRRFMEIAPSMIESMHTIMDSLEVRYDVEYYDASKLEDFAKHPEFFFNSDHLNECGMRAFSEYLLNEMNQR